MNVLNPWCLLRYLPKGMLTTLKHCTGPRTRLWIREHLGAGHTSIPDTILQVDDGRRFHIGPDRVYWSLYFGLPYEIENSGIIGRLLRPGDCVFDVGANFGWFSTLFASIVRPSGHVYAFEPVRSTYDRLRENIEINNLCKYVTTFQQAIGEAEYGAHIHVFREQSHACASLATLNNTDYASQRVQVISIDKLVDRTGIAAIDFLKCDAEGSELNVLRGSRIALQSPDAPIILVELNDQTSEAFGHTRSDIWDFLVDVGYDHFYEIRSECSVRQIDIGEIANLDVLLCAKGDRIARRLGNTGDRQLAAA